MKPSITKTFRGATYRTRATRLGTGMSKTHAPQGWHEPPLDAKQRDVLRLVVHGTTDVLASRSYQFHMRRAVCPCCGQPARNRLVLSDSGRARLAHLRRAKAL